MAPIVIGDFCPTVIHNAFFVDLSQASDVATLFWWLQPAVELSIAGVELSFTAVEFSFTGVELSFTGVELSFTGVELSFTGVELSFTGVELSFTAVELSFGVDCCVELSYWCRT